jgi:hypothetical protein
MTEYQAKEDINKFLTKNSELKKYENMFLELHKSSNFNLFFSKFRKSYLKNKNDKSILNELITAYNLKTICGFHPMFMPEKDFDKDPKKLKQGSYMIFQMPKDTSTKDLARIKTPDILVFFGGESFYVEIKTIENEIKNFLPICQRIDKSIAQIETFGKGLVQIFCEDISDYLSENMSVVELEIIKKLQNNKNIMGVLISYYHKIEDKIISENQSSKTYRKKTKFIVNPNFKMIYRNPINKKLSS